LVRLESGLVHPTRAQVPDLNGKGSKKFKAQSSKIKVQRSVFVKCFAPIA
jgi:hypothetical protein